MCTREVNALVPEYRIRLNSILIPRKAHPFVVDWPDDGTIGYGQYSVFSHRHSCQIEKVSNANCRKIVIKNKCKN